MTGINDILHRKKHAELDDVSESYECILEKYKESGTVEREDVNKLLGFIDNLDVVMNSNGKPVRNPFGNSRSDTVKYTTHEREDASSLQNKISSLISEIDSQGIIEIPDDRVRFTYRKITIHSI